jgi:putative ubiquitin-RnfH superfamily antitoxin RatB of RatAB toxin-antitoxin module
MTRIAVTVIYARPGGQAVRSLELDFPATLGDAVKASGLLEEYAEIDLDARHRVGIFGRLADLNAVLSDGDQVEIYRPLLVDPRESRRRRAVRPRRK